MGNFVTDRSEFLSLLDKTVDIADAGDVKDNAKIIRDTFARSGVEVNVEEATIGPRFTQYIVRPNSRIDFSTVKDLDNNLAADLHAHSIRLEDLTDDKNGQLIGIELPNVHGATVRLGNILSDSDQKVTSSPLVFALGKNVSCDIVVADLAEMPHLLMGGQTGSGKSAMFNNILTSMFFKHSPETLRLILVDPKVVELQPYKGIPHLLRPVITDPNEGSGALKWLVEEMDRRLHRLASTDSKNIGEYNKKSSDTMPYIIFAVDEFSDLMMMDGKNIESYVVQLGQKSRAVGIHMIISTSRPSVDVYTDLIKTNFPSRIAFATASNTDSRIIIHMEGAEKLLGMGDMFFSSSDTKTPIRIQAASVSYNEVDRITKFLKR